MTHLLTAEQKRYQTALRTFVQQDIIPYADQYDREERLSPELLQKMAQQGYIGAIVPQEYGGAGLDMLTLGLLHEEIGRACSSTRSLLTVHSMVAYAILKWGSRQQKMTWLPRLGASASIAAFALSEPDVGSDAKSIQTQARAEDGQYVLQGQKKWITCGQIADLFLVFAQYEGKLTAFLVERNTPGLTITPLNGLFGTRASMAAELSFDACAIPKANLLGGIGFGLAAVATSALDIGRYSVACGSVGIAQACLDATLRYTSERKQFNKYLKDHQLIQHMVTDMITNVKAARLLCRRAGYLKDIGDPGTLTETFIAKYFATTTATKAASDAVQIHGANGCSDAYPVQRYLRDAKVMEIIEGSTQIQQITIAQYGYQEMQSL